MLGVADRAPRLSLSGSDHNPGYVRVECHSRPATAGTLRRVELDADSDVAARIGRRLAELRVRRGVRAAELARQISVTPSLISQIERGQSRPSVTTLFALAQALEVPVDAFFARDAVADGEPPADTGVVGAGDPASWPAGGGGDPARTPVWRAPEHPPELVLHQAQRAAIDIKGGVRWERLTPTALNGV